MTGVDIEQWRGNIGVFHRKKVATKSLKVCNNQVIFSTESLSNLLGILSKPFELLFTLLLLFSYCTMVVFLFPILFTTHVNMIFILGCDIEKQQNKSYFSLINSFQIFFWNTNATKSYFSVDSKFL